MYIHIDFVVIFCSLINAILEIISSLNLIIELLLKTII